MIAYEELCAALDRFRETGGAGQAVGAADATGQTVMPPIDNQSEDATSVGVQAVFEDHSNELDIGDVLSDEEAPKN